MTKTRGRKKGDFITPESICLTTLKPGTTFYSLLPDKDITSRASYLGAKVLTRRMIAVHADTVDVRKITEVTIIERGEEHKPDIITEELLLFYGFVNHPEGNAFENCVNPYWAKDGVLLFYSHTPPHNTYLFATGLIWDGKYFASTMKWYSSLEYLYDFYKIYTGVALK